KPKGEHISDQDREHKRKLPSQNFSLQRFHQVPNYPTIEIHPGREQFSWHRRTSKPEPERSLFLLHTLPAPGKEPLYTAFRLGFENQFRFWDQPFSFLLSRVLFFGGVTLSNFNYTTNWRKSQALF